MLESVRVIAGDMKKLYLTTFMNAIHLILKGAPFGMLFLVLLELLKPKEEIDLAGLVVLIGSMAVIMLINLYLAIRVHIRAYLTSYNLASETRLNLGDHLRKLSLGFFKKRDPGDISSVLLQDIVRVETIFSTLFIDAIACVILPAMMAGFFFTVDWRMTSLMLAAVAVAIPALMLGQKLISYLGRKHVAIRNATSSRMLEYLQGIQVLKAYNLTGKGFKRLDQTMRKLCSESIKLEAGAGGPVVFYMTVLELGFIGLLILGVHLLFQGNITVPVLILFLVIGYKFFEPLIGFGIYISEFRYMNIAAKRITDVLDAAPLKEPDHPKTPENCDIEFSDVSFGYTDAKVLDKVSFRIPEKSMTALVGPSGSGKTTITSLIPRFWEIDQGAITIGGVDIRDMRTTDLYSLISVVFQDVYLFQDTVFNNIKVGRKDAAPEEVIQAAKTAQCHEFIEKMEKGYDTMVGESGATLSGGEKQRISIARALLKDAPIIILDEATASLDPENELLIQQAIGAMVKSKTLLVIAHRLKTITQADNILVIDKGSVIEQGTHEKLLANQNLYARFWSEQQKAGGWKFTGGGKKWDVTGPPLAVTRRYR